MTAVVQTAQSADFGSTATFGAAVTTGNSVVIGVYTGITGGGTISNTTPTLGGVSATLLKAVQSSAGGANTVGAAYYIVPNVSGSPTALSYTANSPTFSVSLFAWEVSGLGSSPVLDQFATNSATTGTAVTSGATPAITSSPEAIFGGATGFNGALGVQGAPWSSNLQDGSNDCAGGFQNATSSGGTYTWSQTAGNSCQWCALVVTISTGAAATPNGQTQPVPTGKLPRRTPARAVWRGGSGQAFVAVAAPRQQPRPAPRRTPARAYIQFTPVRTTNAAPVVATTSAGPAVGVLPYAGGVILQSFTQTFTASGSWTAPAGIIGAPAVYAWGPSGTAATGTAGTGAGGGGGGSIGGEPALGGVTPGTTLTVTIGAAGSGNPSTVTGGSVTVTGNAGGNATTGTGGSAGAASSNTVAFAGGAGGNGAAGGSGGGGGGGGSGGSTGAGGTGNPGVSTTGGTGGAAGTGAAGLTGAAGGNGGTGSNGGAGNAPGGAGGGGSGGATHTGGAASAGQAVIIWQVLTPIPMAMQRRHLARASVQFAPVRTTNTVAVPAPPQLPRTLPRRVPARAYVRFTPVATTNNTAFVAVPAPIQQPRPAPRRTPARAYIQFTPVRTTNAAPVISAGTPPVIPTSGGDRSPTIRVFREIRPGDVPTLGAQLPKLTGRAFAMPVAADVEHVTHAWEAQPEDEPVVPSGPGLAEQVRAELDELTQAARDAAAAIDRAADRARPVVEALGSKAYDLGKIFGNTPYDPRPRKVCGATRMTGGVVLTCQRKPHDDGWHSDKGLHWR